jgi:glutamyl-Q tRNA(Asp) synthetase
MNAYRGRFAPSPTGPLHFGSLFAALISYLDAKAHQGSWLLRLEDIDPLREQAGASEQIVEALKAHHLYWDEDIVFQSAHSANYENALSRLSKTQDTFACPCSRRQLIEAHGRHSEACLNQTTKPQAYAIKFKHTHNEYPWLDVFQGQQSATLDEDFVLKRKEGFYAYQLAVVCDDIEQNITHIIRGYDLLASTPMQLALYKALGTSPPIFGHFPVINHQGQKLSKQNHARAIDNTLARSNLSHALDLLQLGQAAREGSIDKMLQTAIETWQPTVLNSHLQISPDFL